MFGEAFTVSAPFYFRSKDMDRPFKSAGNAWTAAVVRQFAPSRMEKQLLAQVFELVVCERSEISTSSFSGPHTAEFESTAERRSSDVGSLVGRRAS